VIVDVLLSKLANKQLRKTPKHIRRKLLAWIKSVRSDGLEDVRKQPGFHDEPLLGTRKGQRSIRLSIKWRAIYTLHDDGTIEFVLVEEVTPHDY